jgi:hypothetical protein
MNLYPSHLLQHRKLLLPCSLTQRVKLGVRIPEEDARSGGKTSEPVALLLVI